MSRTSRPAPTITVTPAPIRSACFSWPFIERPACSSSTRRPSFRSRRARANAGRAASGSATATYTGLPLHLLGVAGGEQDSLHSGGEAHPGSAGPAELLDQAVVAAAAADGVLRPSRPDSTSNTVRV